MQWHPDKSTPYVVSCNEELAAHFISDKIIAGCTATNIGFYAPQGRKLRLDTSDMEMNVKLESFRFRGSLITNLEMETAGIYGLAHLLGHRAISLNAILANRALKSFSNQAAQTTNALIEYTLERIMTLKN